MVLKRKNDCCTLYLAMYDWSNKIRLVLVLVLDAQNFAKKKVTRYDCKYRKEWELKTVEISRGFLVVKRGYNLHSANTVLWTLAFGEVARMQLKTS